MVMDGGLESGESAYVQTGGSNGGGNKANKLLLMWGRVAHMIGHHPSIQVTAGVCQCRQCVLQGGTVRLTGSDVQADKQLVVNCSLLCASQPTVESSWHCYKCTSSQ